MAKAKLTDICAICLADCHFWHRPPVARSVEKSWLGVQAGYLDQVSDLARAGWLPGGAFPERGLPVLIAGDLFDRYAAVPELVNMLLRKLPERVYACCGQHDLPLHRYEDIERSAYWTLVEAGRVTNLALSKPLEVQTAGGRILKLHGFPFGFPIKPLSHPKDLLIEVAVVHAYMWVRGKGFLRAPEESRLKSIKHNLFGYDAVIIGDNHIPWNMPEKGRGLPTVFNCGSFMRRRFDEQDFKPSVGLLYADGSITRHYLDTSKDQFATAEDAAKIYEDTEEMRAFLEELNDLGDAAADFPEVLRRLLDREGAPAGVRKGVLEALEEGRQ